MKKIIFVFMVILAVLALAGCGGKTSGSSEAGGTKQGAASKAVNYPKKPIKLVIPYAAGGGTDIIFRIISQEAEKELGQPIIVQNITGANATTGSAFVKAAKPDGYTILGHNEGIASAQLTGVVDYSFDAFEPVVGLTKTPMISTVSSKLGIKDVQSFVKYAKDNPGKVKWGITPGQVDHLFMADFMEKFDLTKEELTLISYQGSADLAKGLYSGEISGGTFDVPSAKGYFDDGSFTSIGVAYHERLSQVPDFATYKEQGVEDMILDVTRGIFAPKGTPEEIVVILQEAYKKAIENPEVIDKLLNDSGTLVKYFPHNEFGTVLSELQTKMERQVSLIE
jgi:tripartite-type tricarboxylate transporter receptor subunit TctC